MAEMDNARQPPHLEQFLEDRGSASLVRVSDEFHDVSFSRLSSAPTSTIQQNSVSRSQLADDNELTDASDNRSRLRLSAYLWSNILSSIFDSRPAINIR